MLLSQEGILYNLPGSFFEIAILIYMHYRNITRAT